MRVGDKIRKLRKAKGITQAQLAKMLDVVPTAVSAWERNENRPLMDKLTIISEIFGVSVQTFFETDEFDTRKTNFLIPLIGTICAGDGMLAEQNIEEYIYYPFQNTRQPDYALRVKGDSMIDANIEDGDIVYMKKATWADYNGQIVAALINDNEEGTLKRIHWSSNSPLILLKPENEDYETIEVVPNQLTICGIYMGHFKPEREV